MAQICNNYIMRKNISVRCLMRQDGKVFPLEIEWEDGRIFAIDKVLDIRPMASTKGGGKGIRYTCRINGKQKYLFYDKDDNDASVGVWFVEI